MAQKESPQAGAFRKHCFKLVDLIEDPITFADQMFSASVIERELLAEIVIDQKIAKSRKMQKLLFAVQDHLNTVPEKFDTIMEHINSNPALLEIVKMMQTSLVASPQGQLQMQDDDAVETDVVRLQTVFAELIAKVESVLKAEGNIEKFSKFITGLSAVTKQTYFGDNIPNIQNVGDVSEVFQILNCNKSWGYLSIDLLEILINECGDETSKKSFIKYKSEVNKFRQTTPLYKFSKVHKESPNSNIPASKKVMECVLDQKWSGCTLQEVEDFQRDFVNRFSLEHYSLYLQNFESESTTISWLIPSSVADILEQEVQKASDLLQAYYVVSLAVDKNAVYTTEGNDHHRCRFIKHPLTLPGGDRLSPSIPLVTQQGNKLVVQKTALQLLRSIESRKPVAVLSICGPYRSGKSYFLSQFLGLHSDTFTLGHNTKACTKGIHLATTALECQDFILLLLDSEGLGAVQNASDGDTNQLLVLTTLLSSYLIFNSKEVPKQSDLVHLRCFMHLSTNVLVRHNETSDRYDNSELSEYCPEFLWLLRDVDLEMVDEQERPLSPTQYIKQEVFSKTELKPLETLFPSIECETLPPPKGNPGKSKGTVVEFGAEVNKLIKLLLAKISPKKGFNAGATVNGATLATLTKALVQDINTPGVVPTLDLSWEAVVKSRVADVSEKLLKEYQIEMTNDLKGKLPIEEGQLGTEDHNTLFGVHQSVYVQKWQVFEDEVKSLVPEFSSSPDIELDINSSKNHDLAVQFKRKIAEVQCKEGESLSITGGILHSFITENYALSFSMCTKVFKEEHFNQKLVSLDRLKESYSCRAIGPAKSDVYNKESALIPGPPLNLHVEKEPFKVQIKWDQPEIHPDSAREYEVEVYDNVIDKWRVTRRDVQNATLDQLLPNKKYLIRIRAFNNAIKGEYCKDTEVITPSAPPRVPQEPKIEILTSKTASIMVPKLKKEDENGSPIISFLVEMCSNENQTWKSKKFEPDMSEVTLFRREICLDNGTLHDNTCYHFRVRMENSVGLSEPSTQATVHTCDLIPGPPVVKKITKSHNSITIYFEKPTIHPAAVHDGYEVHIQKSGQLINLPCPVDKVSAMNLKPVTTYPFCVKARSRNPKGEIHQFDVSTDPGPPNRPNQPILTVISPTTAKITVDRPTKSDENGSCITHLIIEELHQQDWMSTDYPIKTDSGMVIEQEIPIKNYSTDTTYSFRLRLKNSDGPSEPSGVIIISTNELYPGPPQHLNATAKHNSILLSWDKPILQAAAAKKYEVEISNDGKDYKLYGKYQAAAYRATINENLKPNTPYWFRVCARNSRYTGKYSEIYEIKTTSGPPQRPAAPTLCIASAEKAIIHFNKISTEDENGSPVTHIIVEKLEEKVWVGTEHMYKIQEQEYKELEIALDSATEDTVYYYRLRMKNGIGASEASETFSVRTTEFFPGPPINIRHEEISYSKLKIRWDMPAIHPIAAKEYEVQMRSFEGEWKPVAKHQKECAHIDQLNPNTQYHFQIRACNSMRTGEYSKEFSVATPPGKPCKPSIPIIDVIGPDKATISVDRLKAEQENGSTVTKLIIERQSNKKEWKRNVFPLTDLDKIPITLDNAKQDTTYYYRVKMVNSAGESEPSEPVQLATSEFVPGKPMNLKLTPGDTFIELKWDIPSFNKVAAAAYQVEIKTAEHDTWQTVITVKQPRCAATVDRLQMVTAYYLRVCALNCKEAKGEYNEADTTTTDLLPGEPRNFRVDGRGENEIKFQWSHPGEHPEAVKQYIIKGTRKKDGVAITPVRRPKESCSAVVKGLDISTNYTFSIGGENTSGNCARWCPEIPGATRFSGRVRGGITTVASIFGLGIGGVAAHYAMRPNSDLESDDEEKSTKS